MTTDVKMKFIYTQIYIIRIHADIHTCIFIYICMYIYVGYIVDKENVNMTSDDTYIHIYIYIYIQVILSTRKM
jgi:hypothetical protein